MLLGYFIAAQDARRALNGLQRHCRDLTVHPLAEPVGGRSWCLEGHVCDSSDQVLITTVIKRWGGMVSPNPLPFRTSLDGSITRSA